MYIKVELYPKLAIDHSRRVREVAHHVQHEMTARVKKRMEKHMPSIISTWFAGISDRDRAVSKAARDGLASFLNTDDKILKCWRLFQEQILQYAHNALDETPQSLCDERSMSADEIQETYLRVLGSSASLVERLLSQLNKSDLLKCQDQYDRYFNHNPTKLWGLISCEDAYVRKVVAQLLVVCLKKQHGAVEANLGVISQAFIGEGLSASQTTSASQLLQALVPLTIAYPDVWTSRYKVISRRVALVKLEGFIAKGSQGGPPTYWKSLEALFPHFPIGVLPKDAISLADFLASLRDGVNHREEPRSNAEAAWTSYFGIANFLVKTLAPDGSSQGQLFQDAVFPVFEHYVHPSLESSKWSLAHNTTSLAKAFVMCATATDVALRQSFRQEWQRLTNEFISRLRTSLPEQSKDYEVSQASIVAEAQRWFSLMNEVFNLLPGDEVNQILQQHAREIITAAISAITSRNGKAYSAAATVEAALRLTPSLFRLLENEQSLKTFFERDLNGLLVSPSMKYLVSILHAFGCFPEHKTLFAKIWQSAVCSILQLPEEEEEQKLRAIITLIASHDVETIATLNRELQTYLYKTCLKALYGTRLGAWPLFETAVTFDTIAPEQRRWLLEQIITSLDIGSKHLEYAYRAMELFVQKNEALLHDHAIHMMLLIKLLALSEIENSSPVSSKAVAMRALMVPNAADVEKTKAARDRVVQLVHNELEAASPQSLL
jgi:E3 ubiquitin-protein ligase listerin